MRGRTLVCVLGLGLVAAAYLSSSGQGAPRRAGAPCAEPWASEPLAEVPELTEVVLPPEPPVETNDDTRVRRSVPAEPPPPGVLTGVVVLPDGKPPTEAEVVVTREDVPGERFQTRPDADGQVWFHGLPTGRYRLRATHPRYAPRSFRFAVEQRVGMAPFDIFLSEGGAILVRVVGAGKTPVENLSVRAQQLSEDPVLLRTDVKGEARFERLPAGAYLVACGEPTACGYCNVHVHPGETAEVVLQVSCGLVGTLFDPEGAPIVGATIRFAPAEHGDEGYRYADVTTDRNGLFELHGLPKGDYRPTVWIHAPRYVSIALDPVTLAEGETRRSDLHIPRGRIEGRVTAAETGAPLDPESVSIEAIAVEVEEGEVIRRHGYWPGWLTPDGWYARHFGRPDAQGRYGLIGLPEGKYEVWVVVEDKGTEPARRLLEVPAASVLQDVDFAIPRRATGILQMRVFEHDGTPASAVFFSERVRDGVERSLAPKQTADGRFEIALPVGPHTVYVYRSRGSKKLAVDVVEGTTLDKSVVLD